MKTIRSLSLLIALVCSLAFVNFASAYSYKLSLTPDIYNTSTIRFNISLSSDVPIIAANFEIGFDDKNLEYKPEETNDFGLFFISSFTDPDGLGEIPPITLCYMGLDSLSAGDYKLAEIFFSTTLADGLFTQPIIYSDNNGEIYSATSSNLWFQNVDVYYEEDSNNSPVPEAPSLWFIGTSIATILLIRRRMSRSLLRSGA